MFVLSSYELKASCKLRVFGLFEIVCICWINIHGGFLQFWLLSHWKASFPQTKWNRKKSTAEVWLPMKRWRILFWFLGILSSLFIVSDGLEDFMPSTMSFIFTTSFGRVTTLCHFRLLRRANKILLATHRCLSSYRKYHTPIMKIIKEFAHALS